MKIKKRGVQTNTNTSVEAVIPKHEVAIGILALAAYCFFFSK